MTDRPLESFVFYRSFRDAIEEMADENKLATLLAICDYALYGIEPDLKDAMSRAVFTVARPSIDANKDRRANGKLGGRPPKKPMVSRKKTNGFQKVKALKLNLDLKLNLNLNLDLEQMGRTSRLKPISARSWKLPLTIGWNTSGRSGRRTNRRGYNP